MERAEQLRVASRSERDRIVISLSGELDMASAPLLQAALEKAETDTPRALVLDLRELDFMDSTGLRIILWARERLHDRGQELALTTGSNQVQRLLSISGVGEHLRVIATPDELFV
jgi:anti-sigma B factor antagonist